ncbi:MAG: TGS domain-containing protein [Candidatus Aenigmarchaeota archaeon]|nr:TGS domain-containing protein [Candidatus Aenigmarchaeota archaeon]
MPVNAPMEYYKAEEKFKSAKTREEKIAALEEMIRLLPKHHGSENAHAQLKSRLAKLKKEGEKKGAKKSGIRKEGDAQICLLGFTNSGKSWLLSKLTSARPNISEHPFTTTKPEIGMMDYKGIKIQIVEIPATFDPSFMSIARTADAVLIVVRDDNERIGLEEKLRDNFIRTQLVIANPLRERPEIIKEKIWSALDMIIVYTKAKGKKAAIPMALPKGATLIQFAEKVHKDFVKNFRFARIEREENKRKRIIQAGLNYPLADGDVVEIHTK